MVFEISREVVRLCDRLHGMKEGDKISYAQMSELVGKDVAGKGRYVLTSARRRLEREGKFFLVDRKVGIVRASNANVSSLATVQPVTKVRRITRQAKKREVHVNLQALTADDRVVHFIGRTVIGLFAEAASGKIRKKIQRELEKAEKEKDDSPKITLSQVVTLPRLKKKEA